VVRLIRTEKPDVIVTMEPFGNYGHNEHIMIHHAATAGFYLSGREDVWPEHLEEGLTPHAAKKLYWGGLSPARPHQDEERRKGVAKARAEMGVPWYTASLVVAYSELAERVYAALSAHRSQFVIPPWAEMEGPWRDFLASDYMLRVHPPIAEGEPPESSITDGLEI